MANQLLAIARDGVALTMANIIGGIIAGIFMMFYRDLAIVLTVRELRRLELSYLRRLNADNQISFACDDPVDSELALQYLKAATFATGAMIIACMLVVIPFGEIGFVVSIGSITIGLFVGALFEHSAWLVGAAKKARLQPDDLLLP